MQDGVVGKRCLASKAQKELCFILKIIGMSNNARRVHRKLQKLIRLFLGVFVAKYARPFLFCGLGGQNVLLNWLSFDVLSFPLFSWKDETPDIFSCECRVSHSFYNTTKDTQINNAIPLCSA